MIDDPQELDEMNPFVQSLAGRYSNGKGSSSVHTTELWT